MTVACVLGANLLHVEWFEIDSGYYGVGLYEISAEESASHIVDAAFVSAFGLASDEASELFGDTAHDHPTGLTIESNLNNS